MSTDDPLKLTIVDERNGQVRIDVAIGSRSAADNDLLRPFAANAADLPLQHERLLDELELARIEFGGGLEGTPRAAGQALSRLWESGVQVVDQLFGKREGTRFRSLLAESLRNATPSAPGVVEISSPLRFSLPIEILPSAQIALASLPYDETTLRPYAQGFPGYTAVVKRIITEANGAGTNEKAGTSRDRDGGLLPQDVSLYLAPELTVAFYWHATAPGSDADLAYFTGTKPDPEAGTELRLYGPMPDGGFEPPSYESIRRLTEMILSPPTFVHPGDSTLTPYQLVHISAHSESGRPGVSQSSQLILGRVVRRKRLIGAATDTERYPIGSGTLYQLSQSRGKRVQSRTRSAFSSCREPGPRPSATLISLGLF